ncbi:LacI family DNA-binding transcriptional regulator [Blastococcus sp. VKM Ac-2987]|uniref:LacI family DNA-binding transcriptional regulator n=1 Tax=Blastococcus sp. VKM Ac-2987 TaxID=3004141 RepID=UPI0022AB7DA0|nr:LacI family DNA-binding transcriptional regulator [Blastococcus sp. VKM Ac-2987]MCZ2860322.1 LacI family DNA-binding transcriptional regulator [Blastococcus sp. VKM Ac-2987]
MTTMRDVAARAGVSAKTVSRVFNDDPHVLPETRARVGDALRELGYVPNSVARTFRTGRPPALGVAVPDLADPFFAVLAKAVEDVAVRADLAVVVSSTGYDARREAGALESLLRRSLSGLVVAPTSSDQAHLGTWATRLPIVFVDRPPRGLTADAFTGDDHEGGRLATAHLVAHGHRDIAFVGDDPAMTTTGERLAGHRSALADAGLPPRDELVAFGADDRESARRVVARLRSAASPPTALVSGDARTTMALVPVLAGSSWAVVGFGDFPMAHMLSPALTVVDQDPATLGRLAAERVVERLGAPDRRFRRRTIVPVRLVERRSCWSPADASTLFPSSSPESGTGVWGAGSAAPAGGGTRSPTSLRRS